MKTLFITFIFAVATTSVAMAAAPEADGGGISPENVGTILGYAITALGGYGGCALINRVRARGGEGGTAPLDVKLADKYAAKEDLNALEKRQADFEKETRKLIRESETNVYRRLDSVCTKLDDLSGLVRGLTFQHTVSSSPFIPAAPNHTTMP